MNSAHSFTEGMEMDKPRFLICFQYLNSRILKDKPYLVPLNKEAHEFRAKFYGKNGMVFNHECK